MTDIIKFRTTRSTDESILIHSDHYSVLKIDTVKFHRIYLDYIVLFMNYSTVLLVELHIISDFYCTETN